MDRGSPVAFDATLLRSLPASVVAGSIVAFPIPPAPGLWPFLKLFVAGVVAGGIYGATVPGTKPGQSNLTRGGKAGMAVGLPAFLLSHVVWAGTIDFITHFGPAFIVVFLIGPFLTVVGIVPGAIGGVLGNRLGRRFA